LRQLYSLLITPVLESVPAGIRKIVVSPDGVLNLVPFPALRPEGGRFLIEDFTISTVESASIWTEEKRRASAAPRELLGIFAPMAASGPDARLSVRSEHYPMNGEGEDRFWAAEGSRAGADKAATIARMQAGGALHVSGHGLLSSAVADHQTIVLATGASPDSALDAYEVRRIAGHGWSVVTLGICDGGIMRYGDGDE